MLIGGSERLVGGRESGESGEIGGESPIDIIFIIGLLSTGESTWWEITTLFFGVICTKLI